MAPRYCQGVVQGFLHEPAGPALGGIVLTHGAGLNSDSPLLAALAFEFAERGLFVLRCDLAFRQKRRSGPPFPAGAQADRDGLREALRQLCSYVSAPLFLGGHSYGGRQASILLTEPNPPAAAALLLLSFPLHPPRKPEQLRSAHFPQLHAPVFFFHGTRDSFGSPEEIQSALSLLPSSTPRALILADRAGHELSAGRSGVAAHCANEFLLFTRIHAALL